MQSVETGVVFRPQSPPERLREAVAAAEAAGEKGPYLSTVIFTGRKERNS